jgi:ligand-binding sensor domain-containing protein/two-component sensor histidine kinase
LNLLNPNLSRSQVYNFRNFTVKDGVAQSQVYSLIQDSRGYIWMGTRGGGITRYDGVQFQSFTVRDGLANNYVSKIIEDSNKNLWIATNNGLSYYNGITFQTLKPGPKEKQLVILDIALDSKGQLWIASSSGLYLYANKTFTNISEQLGLKKSIINTVFVDSKSHVWFGTDRALYQLTQEGRKLSLVDFSKESRYMVNAITCIKEDKKGNLWIGTYGDGLYCFNQKSFFRIDPNHELYKQTIFDIYFDNETYWIATLNQGIKQYNLQTKSFTSLTEKEGLSNNHVRSIIQDNSGSFWFGTSGGGVCNYLGKKFTTYDKNSGLAGNFIYSIFRDSKNRLWVGNSQQGVSKLDSAGFKNYNRSTGFADIKVKAINEDIHGLLFFGTEGKGVYIYDGETFSQSSEFGRSYIRSIQKDSKGNLWFATAGHGIFKRDTIGNISNFNLAEGLPSNRITSLQIDKKNRVWFGTENLGIGYIEKDKVAKKRITSFHGLASNAIRSLVEDELGFLWVGTAGNGISSFYLYKSEIEIQTLDYQTGLKSTNIYLLTFDHENNLISGSEKGLDYVFLDKNRKVKQVKHYASGDGFTGIETCQNAVYNDADGKIWFGTINGLSMFNPANSSFNPYEPITNIVDIKLFYESIHQTIYKNQIGDWNQVPFLNLPYEQNHISFDFNAINLINSEGVRYQWKLEGFDKSWSPISKEKSILYSNLFPGDYTFFLKACNEDGVWNEEPKSIKIHIETPFWLRKDVLISAGIFVILLFVLTYKWQIKRIRKKASKEQKQLRLEKEFVELEQKALRLQMNPHFIFNAINSIQSLIGTGKEQEARYYLAKFSRLMRQILDNSRSTNITLEEEINTLENYLLIEKFCNGDRFDYSIEVDEKIEQDFIQIPPMLLQPFIENAIKHGFKFSNEQRGKIKIKFTENQNTLNCIIEDNGIGRIASETNKSSSKEPHHISTAMHVIQERLKLFEQNDNLESLEIIDLIDENKNSLGTKIIVRIPI